MHPPKKVGTGALAFTLASIYPKHTILALALFVGQAFPYNAIFFTQALVLSKFFAR